MNVDLSRVLIFRPRKSENSLCYVLTMLLGRRISVTWLYKLRF